MNDDVIARLQKLPDNVKGFTLVDENGFYNIYINKDLLYEERRKVFKHEFAHIKNGDFNRDKDLNTLERKADAGITGIGRNFNRCPKDDERYRKMVSVMSRIADAVGNPSKKFNW